MYACVCVRMCVCVCVPACMCMSNVLFFHWLQVKMFDTLCDVDRVKEWAVRTVKHVLSSRDNAIKVIYLTQIQKKKPM